MTTIKRWVNRKHKVLEQSDKKEFLLQLKRHVKILCYKEEYITQITSS